MGEAWTTFIETKQRKRTAFGVNVLCVVDALHKRKGSTPYKLLFFRHGIGGITCRVFHRFCARGHLSNPNLPVERDHKMAGELFPPPDLRPSEPLSQVVFVHDYLQLVFQSQCFSIYNLAQVTRGEVIINQGTLGFCDALVSLIGNRVLHARHCESHKLMLEFENGDKFFVPTGADHVRGPEAFQYDGSNEYLVVEQNE